MSNKFLWFSISIIISSILMYSLIVPGKISIKYIYWLPFIWLGIAIVIFKVWKIGVIKYLLLFHILILLSGLFSFLTYQVFKKLSSVTSITSKDFTKVSNLMFNSENALYLMIYAGMMALIFDLIYFFRVYKKQRI